MIARSLALLLAATCLVFAGGAFAQEVLLDEPFNPGFDASGWWISNIHGDGVWTIDSTRYHTADGSLKFTGAVGNLYFGYDAGEIPGDLIYEAWFYDDLASTLEAHVSVSADPGYLSGSSGHLRIGVSCSNSPTNYIAVTGFHTSGNITLGPSRSEGWHHVKFWRSEGTTHCYLDGNVLLSTSFQSEWRYAILNEDNLCTTGSSWFDDVLVYELGAVSVPSNSLGAFKSQFNWR